LGDFSAVSSLKQSTIFEIVLDDDVRDSVEDELNVVCVGGAGEVRVDFLLVFSFVQIFEFHANVTRSFFVRV
jgi:hypothetical protein